MRNADYEELLDHGVKMLPDQAGDDEIVEIVRVFRMRGPRGVVNQHLARARAAGVLDMGGIEYTIVWGPIVPVKAG